MTFVPPIIASIVAPIATPGGAIPVTPWYLLGGVTTAQCAVAYQPKGAASLAASYSNLNNPGTNDAALGTAPTLGAGGWVFASVSSQYLVVPNLLQSTAWSFLIRVSSWTRGASKSAFGEFQDVGHSMLVQSTNATTLTFYHNGSKAITNSDTSGVFGVAGPTPYINGAAQTDMTQTANTSIKPMWIAAINSAGQYSDVTVAALAIYNVTLSPTQAGLISTAMAAL